MRIAYFTDTFLPNCDGVVTSVVNAAKRLAKKGHEIAIFTSMKKNQPPVSLGRNISVHFLVGIDVLKYPGYELALPEMKLVKTLNAFHPDILHCHAPSPLCFGALVYGKIMKLPVLGTYHTLLPDFLEYFPIEKLNKTEFLKTLTWSYTNQFYNRCTKIISPSENIKKELMQHGATQEIVVVSNGVDLNMFYPKNVKHNQYQVLHVGRISYEKNIELAIRAFLAARRQEKRMTMTIVGSGPDLERLRILYEPRGVVFTGKIEHQKLPEIYSAAGIFLTASTIETEGLVLLEAMACGLPIVGVNRRAIPELVKHGKQGLIAEEGNRKELTQHMVTILKNQNVRKSMSNQAISSVKPYHLNRTIKKLEHLYLEVQHAS